MTTAHTISKLGHVASQKRKLALSNQVLGHVAAESVRHASFAALQYFHQRNRRYMCKHTNTMFDALNDQGLFMSARKQIMSQV